jgi:hypothetical protein
MASNIYSVNDGDAGLLAGWLKTVQSRDSNAPHTRIDRTVLSRNGKLPASVFSVPKRDSNILSQNEKYIRTAKT